MPKKKFSRKWHRKPRNKTFARHIGTQSEIERTEQEIKRLELRIAEDNRKRAEALDRERYHALRLRDLRSSRGDRNGKKM